MLPNITSPVLTVSQRRFNDQITGHSGLTFFEAFESEVGFFYYFILRIFR